MTNGLLTELLKSPRLVEFNDRIGRTLRDEEQAREVFRSRAGNGHREEFINGEVVELVSSRDAHIVCLDFIHTLINTFVRIRKLGAVRREQALIQFPRNDYCPDLCFWMNDQQVGADPNQTIYPPPNLIIEVLSPTTESRDRGVKFEDYEAHGVKEYWIVDPDKRTIEQYVAHNGKYERMFAGSNGVLRSVMIAALDFPVLAAFDDAVQMLALQAILRNED